MELLKTKKSKFLKFLKFSVLKELNKTKKLYKAFETSRVCKGNFFEIILVVEVIEVNNFLSNLNIFSDNYIA